MISETLREDQTEKGLVPFILDTLLVQTWKEPE